MARMTPPEADLLLDHQLLLELRRDRLGVALLLCAALGWLGLLAFIAWQLPQLPAEVVLRYNSAGQVDRAGDPAGLLVLPMIGAASWAINGVLGAWAYRPSRAVAYWLWGTGLAVQVLAWLAAGHLLG